MRFAALFEISNLLNTGLDKQSLAVLVELIGNSQGISTDVREGSQAVRHCRLHIKTCPPSPNPPWACVDCFIRKQRAV